ncbi:MAG: phosphoribosylglycinamide formyltransferase [Phycisphaerales bacterium]|nr:phosphoribosylglycinamide formyltransferase [Phycisphaerales bacterium]
MTDAVPKIQPARLAVLLSGSGRTLDNLVEHIDQGTLDATIKVVVGSRECLGVEKAKQAGIPTLVCETGIDARTLDRVCDEHAIDWVILAGYLKLVPITDRVRGRVINIHPSLLPSFGGKGMHGMHVHRAVVEAARRGEINETGCTVHFADEEFDQGAIIEQRRCEVTPSETPEQVAARVFELECDCLPNAIRSVLSRCTH